MLIMTRFLSPTDTLGGRIVAYTVPDPRTSRTVVPWDYSYDTPTNHELAVSALLRRFADSNRGFYVASLVAATDEGYAYAAVRDGGSLRFDILPA